tara:strand:- start:770 stop:1210 length:441 start_codon:yes stop_codon:yes gene_type:complete
MFLDILSKNFYKDFQEYIFKHEVLIAASGFTIGIATSDFIKKLIDEILKPIALTICSFLFGYLSISLKLHPIILYISFKLFNLISLILAWLFTIFVAFFVIEYILNRKVVGLSTVILEEDKKEFIAQKIESKKNNNIIPNYNNIIE